MDLRRRDYFLLTGIFVLVFISFIPTVHIDTNIDNSDVQRPLDVKNIHEGLLAVEGTINKHDKGKAALGFGACIDGILRASDAFAFLDLESSKGQDHEVIGSLEQLSEVFSYFFEKGAAAERYVGDEDTWNALVNAAKGTETTKWSLGGNAPMIGMRMSRLGSDVIVGGRFNEDMYNMKISDFTVAGGLSGKDDVDYHIILEYQRNEQWYNLTSPRANRLALHADRFNPQLESLEPLLDTFAQSPPHLLVLSAFQMMDGFPFEGNTRLDRIRDVSQRLHELDSDIKTHFEMASFVELGILDELMEHVISKVNSLGMNEQELVILRDLLQHHSVTHSTNSAPTVREVLDDVRYLFPAIRNKSNSRSLNRIHVHTLAFQLIVAETGTWPSNAEAVAEASLVGTRHTCQNEEFGIEDVMVLLDESFRETNTIDSDRHFFHGRPVLCWTEKLEENNGTNDEMSVDMCLAPVLTCKEALQTIGAGDNITGAALAVQINAHGGNLSTFAREHALMDRPNEAEAENHDDDNMHKNNDNNNDDDGLEELDESNTGRRAPRRPPMRIKEEL
eukprot:TRINITY_DN13845_c0_g1_i1.p1 TRINITY_DN13845_c0_g1~~TRINITY_DN13845_c0_g1_i1.p1  ORF type:complete len:562 (-),score=160.52 TRINITY_DN13845_c0_g1_i1:100-1785(-)